MAHRVNRAIELLEQGQAIYYDGQHSGHVLTHEQGRHDEGQKQSQQALDQAKNAHQSSEAAHQKSQQSNRK